MTKIRFFTSAALFFAALLFGAAPGANPAQAAAKQYVVIVAEGASPQLLDLGRSHLRLSTNEPELSTAFDLLIAEGKSALVEADALSQMQGLLESAEESGYKTGLVTTGDLLGVAPRFYSLSDDVTSSLTSPTAKYDFIAGGGRAKLGADIGGKIRASGGTYLHTQAELDNHLAGRVLAPQAEGELDFALDRDPTQQAGLGELALLAMDTLGAGDTPFVLIIHDTLIKKALDTQDTPALFEQFRELNAIVADVAARRAHNPQAGYALLLTGADSTPRFFTQLEAERQSALLAISQLALSYAGAGKALQGADIETLAAFIDPNDGQYKGLQLSPQAQEQLLAGTLEPESAVRGALEASLKMGFDGPQAPPVAYSLGIDNVNGLISGLKTVVGTPAK